MPGPRSGALVTDEPKRAEIEEVLSDIASDGERASETIHRLRTLFRKAHSERVAVDIDAIIEDVLGLVRSDMVGKRIMLHYARGSALPPVLGDPVQLRQIFLNLIVNAAEAIASTEDGPREIRISTSRPDAGQVAVAIHDSGIGVQASELERIFEHFRDQQAPGARDGAGHQPLDRGGPRREDLGDSQRGSGCHAARRVPSGR